MTDRLSTASKIMTVDEAVTWRRARRGSVVFTNGVFDLVHPGHITVLEEARALGDSLIVAVNDDRSVRTLEVAGRRPSMMSFAARARIVAAFAASDCVVPMSAATPESLIVALAPDVLVKGGDYEDRPIPGSAEVLARGGRVVLVPLVPGHSTTQIVERIRATTR